MAGQAIGSGRTCEWMSPIYGLATFQLWSNARVAWPAPFVSGFRILLPNNQTHMITQVPSKRSKFEGKLHTVGTLVSR